MDSVPVILTLFNMGLAGWVCIEAIAALVNHIEGRDPRPLVMPIFCGLAYFGLAYTWLGADGTSHHNPMTLLAWQMVHFGMLLGLHLFVRMYGAGRA